MAKTLTPSAAGIAIRELEKARKHTKGYAQKTGPSCFVKTAMGLPCRHLFSWRLQRKEEIFSASNAFQEWCVGYEDRRRKRKSSHTVTTHQQKKRRAPKQPLSKDAKLKKWCCSWNQWQTRHLQRVQHSLAGKWISSRKCIPSGKKGNLYLYVKVHQEITDHDWNIHDTLWFHIKMQSK